ncbi:hypothetical protein Dfri01_19030 [Dyadobacter frigoris]|nr:hypothetical protein Dfri01_19030 [Dyadobacter frigoris]
MIVKNSGMIGKLKFKPTFFKASLKKVGLIRTVVFDFGRKKMSVPTLFNSLISKAVILRLLV